MEKLIFEYSQRGRKGYTLPDLDVPEKSVEELVPKSYLRAGDAKLPEVNEVDVMRHFVRLSTLNHHVDKGFYPLGSCTMKYNPKINEDLAGLQGFRDIHPLQPAETIQGALKLIYELSQYLCEISGMDAVSLQPAAGAHGELVSMLIARQFHAKKGNPRKKILIPDSAHGTNPASVVLSGYEVVQIRSDEEGLVDIQKLRTAMDDEVAVLMLTVPNTLGLFESEMGRIAEIVHERGGLLYLDGANLNALLGIVRPGDIGFDLMHFNLHKTFSTPHGGGGPGSGPVGVKRFLEPFLPIPVVRRDGGRYRLDCDHESTIGRVHGFYGQFLVMVKAYTYIRMLGGMGLRKASETAIVNAAYIRENLRNYYALPYKRMCMHECVLSAENLRQHGVRTLDVAKRILDFGLHAPTVYFPLIVKEALMIEPTETESKERLDEFINVMKRIASEAAENPAVLKDAPTETPVRRLDEVKAVKELDVRARLV